MLDGDKKTDCTHCEGGESQWNISLDLDLLQTIVNFYPEWFSMNAEGKGIKLQNGHKESCASFQEQRQKLVKARIGSILKHKLPKKLGNQQTIKEERTTFELVKENIFVDTVQAFKSPCNSPKMRFGLDDDSDGTFSPTPPYEFNEHSQGSLPSLEASEPSPILNQASPCSEITSFSMSPPSSVSSPMPSLVSPHEQIAEYMVHIQPQHSVAANKNKKKTKPKTQPKARTIKFHEYKGPPNSKNTSSNTLPESPPQLNFQQQQLILELQSAFHKHDSQANDTTVQKISGDQSGERDERQHPITLVSHFEDLKVSDLRAELKRRNLPVSGSKPQLIERLKSHNPSQSGDTELLNAVPSFDSCDSLDPLSKEEIIVQLQQIYIERLQMDLERSQRQLLECQQPMSNLTPGVSAKSPTETTVAMPSTFCQRNNENKTSQKQLIQQLLQQKIQKQQKNHRLKADTSIATTSNSTLTALLKSSPLNADNRSSPAIKRESYSEEDDFPGVIPILVSDSPTDANPDVISPSNRSSSLPSFSDLCKTPVTQNPQFQISRPPPDYNAATKHLQKVKQPPSPTDGNPRQPKKPKTCIKSQAVDDVLAVLIASGDLPPSAAEEPNNFQTADLFSSAALAQSLMDITPPSSAGLDFGPLLDLDEMDFGLDEDAPALDPTFSRELKATLDYSGDNNGINSKAEKGMQPDLMEWLPVQNDLSPSNNLQSSLTESLFPQDALDFLEEDFSAQEDLFFPWGEDLT